MSGVTLTEIMIVLAGVVLLNIRGSIRRHWRYRSRYAGSLVSLPQEGCATSSRLAVGARPGEATHQNLTCSQGQDGVTRAHAC